MRTQRMIDAICVKLFMHIQNNNVIKFYRSYYRNIPPPPPSSFFNRMKYYKRRIFSINTPQFFHRDIKTQNGVYRITTCFVLCAGNSIFLIYFCILLYRIFSTKYFNIEISLNIIVALISKIICFIN